MSIIVTVSGKAGSGKSTITKIINDALISNNINTQLLSNTQNVNDHHNNNDVIIKEIQLSRSY